MEASKLTKKEGWVYLSCFLLLITQIEHSEITRSHSQALLNLQSQKPAAAKLHQNELQFYSQPGSSSLQLQHHKRPRLTPAHPCPPHALRFWYFTPPIPSVDHNSQLPSYSRYYPYLTQWNPDPTRHPQQDRNPRIQRELWVVKATGHRRFTIYASAQDQGALGNIEQDL